MKLVWGPAFSGIRPRVDERILPDGAAQVAENVYTDRGGLRSMRAPEHVLDLEKSDVQTIYRFGQALDSETQYWFHWDEDVDVVKGPIANDTDERTYWTGDGAPKYTTASLGTSGDDLPSASRPLGVSAPLTAPSLDATGDPLEDAGSETRVYIYTFVTDDGAESAPSAPATIDIVTGEGVTISNMETTADNGAVLATKRIYRAQQGLYLFVAEIPAATTSYDDTLESASLGEPCPSIEWDMPPETLTALTGGPNGMMAGVDGYTVRLCAPYRPHAWPMAYSQTVDYPCVGLGQFGQSFVVLTTGWPFILTGVDPGSMTLAPAKLYQPCVSKRSIVSAAGSVIWASPDGLIALSQDGESNLTEGIFTEDQWRALHPETLIGAWHEGWYVGSYDTGDGRRAFRLRPGTTEWIDLPGIEFTAAYRDTVGDALYLCIDDAVHKFGAGEQLAMRWRSGEVVTPLSDFVVARVTGDYPVTFKLYRDDTLRFTKSVDSDEPFKLPAGLGRSWSVEAATTTGAVVAMAIATSEAEI